MSDGPAPHSAVELISTSLGQVPVKIADRGFDRVIVVIRGAFADLDQMERLSAEKADIAYLHLPGWHSPRLVDTSIGAFIAAFDEVLRQRFSERRLTLLGLSAGAIVAAGLRSGQIDGRILVEPFFRTERLWALHEIVRSILPTLTPADEEWAWRILGIAPDRVENRDYSAALRMDGRLVALVGEEPLLPRRPMWRLPSLTDAADRARLRAGGVDVRLVAGGHDVATNAPDAIVAALEDLSGLAIKWVNPGLD